jgi:2-amino-4-hydroxy-6-hydroxymethyldihydropteridine diphosphokinase
MKGVAYLGLGSNLGDRRQYLASALRGLVSDPAISLVAGSSIYESKPVGVVDQPDFLNLVVQIETSHLPLGLLAVCLRIEAGLGRERRERWGPRTVDLDLLNYDDVVLHDEPLVLPHPRMHERSFVMTPLAEIAPELKVKGKKCLEVALELGAEGLHPTESWSEFSRWAKFPSRSSGEP